MSQTASFDNFEDPYQREWDDFITESLEKIQNEDTTAEAAAKDFASRWQLPPSFVAYHLNNAIMEQASSAYRM